jgi:hypothetical protein
MRYHSLIALAASLLTKAVAARDEYEGYTFIYFVNNTLAGENIFMAASNGNDVLSWTELNGDQAVLRSEYGTKGLRDPFVLRSHDGGKFYLMATDLSTADGISWDEASRHGSRYLEFWESEDLVNWSEQRHVLISPETAGMSWAPEAYYDDELGTYLVYWASALYDEEDTEHEGSTYTSVLSATTDDFVTFSEAVVWQGNGRSRIDSTVIKEGDAYYRFTKDQASWSGCADIIQEHSLNLSSQLDSWTLDDACIGKDAGTGGVEGPSIVKSNPNDVNGEKFYLFVDEAGGRGYIPLETEDIANPEWIVSSQYNLPDSPRHGVVLPITKAELEKLNKALGSK